MNTRLPAGLFGLAAFGLLPIHGAYFTANAEGASKFGVHEIVLTGR